MKKILLMALVGLFITTNTEVKAAFPVKTEKTTTVSTTVKLEKTKKAEIKAAKEELDSEMSAASAAGGGKSQIVALLLCFFLGMFGVHDFYLKRPLTGFIKIGLFVVGLALMIIGLASVASGSTSIPTLALVGYGMWLIDWIWALVDLIRILVGGLKPADGEYDKTF